jgi:hypothetical protein
MLRRWGASFANAESANMDVGSQVLGNTTPTDASTRALPHTRWFQVAACVLLFLFARFHMHQIVTGSIRYDDAFVATVAKNVALGYGYSTSYHSLDLFDPEISTGPTVVLPAAVLMSVFGNQYWVPNLSIAVAIWFTLIMMLTRLRQHVGRQSFPLAIAFLAAGLVVFATAEFGLLGELPGVLLVGSAFIILSDDSANDRAKGIVAGLTLGLALNAKLIVMFACPAIVVIPLVETAVKRLTGRGSEPNWRRMAWCLAALPVPILAWQVYQLIAVSGNLMTWVAIKRRELAFLAGSGSLSGVGQLRQAPMLVDRMLQNLADNHAAFAASFGGWARVLPGIAGLAAAFIRVAASPGAPRRTIYLSRLLACAAVLHFSWWFLASPSGYYRHLFPGIIYIFVLGAVLLTASMRVSRHFGLASAACCLVSVALVLPVWARSPHACGFGLWARSHYACDLWKVFKWDFQPEPRLTALLQTRDELIRLQEDSSVLLVGCGWWVARDLEYVSPGVNNFRDCTRLQSDETLGKRIILVRNEVFNWDNRARMKQYQEYCDQHILYRNDPFVVSECRGTPDWIDSPAGLYPVKY